MQVPLLCGGSLLSGNSRSIDERLSMTSKWGLREHPLLRHPQIEYAKEDAKFKIAQHDFQELLRSWNEKLLQAVTSVDS